MNKKRSIERIKNIAICLLFISMCLLCWKSGVFQKPAGASPALEKVSAWFKSDAAELQTDENIAAISAEAARPLTVVVTDDDGGHYAVRSDRDELDRLYERSGRVFKEALGSAREPVQISELYWFSVLGSRGVCFEYMEPVQLSILDGWLGTEISGLWREMSVRYICVYENSGTVCLAFSDAGTGLYYKTETSVLPETLLTQLSGTQSNGAYYLFETDEIAAPRESCIIITGEDTAYPLLDASNPLDDSEILDSMLAVFGVSHEFASSYPESDGTLVFVENDCTIRVSTDGHFTYRFTENTEERKSNIALAVETVRVLAEKTISTCCGDAEVRFLSASVNSDGTYSVEFCYAINGGRIFSDDSGAAATAKVKNGTVTELELVFRTYTQSEDTKRLLPELQAAAASGGKRFVLGYSDFGTDRLLPEWFIM